MIDVPPAPTRETNERGEWINQDDFMETSGRYLDWIAGSFKQIRSTAKLLQTRQYSVLRIESRGRGSMGARAVHLRAKALRRESRHCRYPAITLELAGIL